MKPYKCSYAKCQKTFTRRTNLTRHQSQHEGANEEVAAETNAKLSIGKVMTGPRPDGIFGPVSNQSDGAFLSDSRHNSLQQDPFLRAFLPPPHTFPPVRPSLPSHQASYGLLPLPEPSIYPALRGASSAAVSSCLHPVGCDFQSQEVLFTPHVTNAYSSCGLAYGGGAFEHLGSKVI